MTWTLEYGGYSNNWKLEGYDLVKGYGISENYGEREREKHNVFGIYLVGFCDTQRQLLELEMPRTEPE